MSDAWFTMVTVGKDAFDYQMRKQLRQEGKYDRER
jgi:hypothetical protein